MNRLSFSVCAAGAIGGFIALGLLERPAIGQGNGLPAGRDVRVINLPTEPVPVSLNGTGTVKGDVNVVNTPGVNVLNKPTVKIDTAQPIPVVDAGAVTREPFQIRVHLTNNLGDSDGITGFSVPAGKKLVIEYVNAWMNKRGGLFIDGGGDTPTPTVSLPIRSLLVFKSSPLGDRYAGEAEVRFHGTGFQRVLPSVDFGETGFFGELTVVGYLIPSS